MRAACVAVIVFLAGCGSRPNSGPSGGGGQAATSASSGGASTTTTGGQGGGGGAPPPSTCSGLVDPPVGPFAAWFTEVEGAGGLDAIGADPPAQALGNGVAVSDLDGDGLPDLVIATGKGGPTRVYKNQGGLAFTDATATFAPAPLTPGYGVSMADLDGDGDADLVVTGEGTIAVHESAGGLLVDRTQGSGLVASERTRGAIAGDLDGDGAVDLYVLDRHGRFYRNQGGFQFEEQTASAGLAFQSDWPSWSGAIFDHDEDGATDLLVQLDTNVVDLGTGAPAPDRPPGDRLFHADGAPGGPLHFTDRAVAAGVGAPRSSMGALVADFDRDGRLDLYGSNIGKNPLFLARDGGTFVEAADTYGVGATRRLNHSCKEGSDNKSCLLHSWGAALFDADHDGWDDLVVVSGATFAQQAEQPARAFRGTPEGGFSPVETAVGCLNARAMVPVDLDLDGDLDVVVTTVSGPVHLFRNDAPAAAGWLRVALRDEKGGNRQGLGAVVTAHLASGRSVTRLVSTAGVVLSSGPAEVHFTTGGEAILALDVLWPSGDFQHIDAVPLDEAITIERP